MSERLSLEEFGRQVLAADDLDPVYNAFHRADLPEDQARRFLLAYWCFYNMGFAGWCSEAEGEAFWNRMRIAAINETNCPAGGRWPRGRERRHFRGSKCVGAIDWLQHEFPRPEQACYWLEVPGSFLAVRDKVTQWPLFGPWIAFKIGDMLERCMAVPVDFSTSDIFMFDSPKKAAELWSGKTGSPAIQEALGFLQVHFGNLVAPGGPRRLMGLQEYETILCKWGSHMTGHYPVGIDTRELRHALKAWEGISDTVRRML